MDVRDLIQDGLNKREEERRLVRENSGWVVQYLPCGHVRDIDPHEIELVAKAKTNKHIDALVQPSEDCPKCKHVDLFLNFLMRFSDF